MQNDSVKCKNCGNAFIVEPDDFGFYEKISVPPPTWCPECRLRRRLAFRNERSLYRRKCNAPGHGEEIISTYSPDKPLTVFDQKYYWGDEWDATSHGRDYNFSRPFFEQMKELIHKVPWMALFNMNAVNSEYCNFTTDNKNYYLVFGGDFNENCSYSTFNFHSKDSMDLYFVNKCELCYECVDTENCYRVSYSKYSKSCHDSMFLYDCSGCSNCVGCANLRNKTHCIFNIQYSPAEYKKKLAELRLDTISGIQKTRQQFEEFLLKVPHRYARVVQSVESTGDNIINAKNCANCFDIDGPARI